MTSFLIEKSFNPLLAPMQNKEDPTSFINMTSIGKIAQKLTKRTDKTTLSFAVKYQYGDEYHTDNSQQLSKYKDYLTRNLATKHSTAKYGQNNQ